jgi:hypothetical protein
MTFLSPEKIRNQCGDGKEITTQQISKTFDILEAENNNVIIQQQQQQ